MASLFSMIIDGELPARFVWQDPEVVAFLDVRPFTHGHTLVVPREPVDHWTDAEPSLSQRVFRVAQIIGQGQKAAFAPPRIALLVAGFDVAHLHVHVFPAESMHSIAPPPVDARFEDKDLDEAAERLRAALRALGHGEFVPAP
jgi:diadenosine tetraphosphate (Ap4A) HIT family hydrolase